MLSIQRMSTEDGPGIRSTVFFKGCSLACDWCQNPESIAPRPETVWAEWKCIGCRTCVGVCPERAITATAGGLSTDRGRCTACGTCVEACPSTARERLGTEWELDALVAEVEKDREYYEESGGGVTASGGDPVVRAPFVGAFLAECRRRGLATALDTSGLAAEAVLLGLAAQADLVLYDLKLMDTVEHARLTGEPNERILANAEALARAGVRLWIRTPLVPGATATEDNVAAIGAFIAGRLGGRVERWELCAFNNLCRDKYRRLGRPWRYESVGLLDAAALERLAAAARASGVDPARVRAGGPTAREEEKP